jgi:hypothetical protein
MRARRESDGDVGVALRIKGGAGKLAAVVAEDDSSGSGKAVFAQDGDGDGGRCAPGLIVGADGRGGLSGHARGTLSGDCHCGHGKHCCRDTDCCNQLKPQTAADRTSHVHLLQKLEIVYCLVDKSVEPYCIRQGWTEAMGSAFFGR